MATNVDRFITVAEHAGLDHSGLIGAGGGGVTLLSTTNGVVLTAGGPYPLYTVPSTATIVITQAVLRATNANTVTVNPEVGIGVTGDDMLASREIFGLLANDDTYLMSGSTQGVVANGSDSIQLTLTTPATATALEVSVDLFGYFVGNTGGGYVGEWTQYTPTLTNITIGDGQADALYKVVGDTLEIQARVDFGSTTSVGGNIYLGLPAGFSIDTGKIPFSGGGLSTLAIAGQSIAVIGATRYQGVVFMNTTSQVGVVAVPGTVWNASTPGVWANGSSWAILCKVPLVI